MMRYFAILCAVCVWGATCAQWHPANDPNWSLVWGDEFDTDYPHSSTSEYKDTFIDTSLWYDNVAWHQSAKLDNAYGEILAPNFASRTFKFQNLERIEPGAATLQARNENPNYRGKCWDWICTEDTIECIDPALCNDTVYKAIRGSDGQILPCPNGGYQMFREVFANFSNTTGMLLSKRKFKYGYFEIRMKIPQVSGTQGYQPNFWLWSNTPKVWWSEIDIYEIRAHESLHTSNVIYQETSDSSATPQIVAKTDRAFDLTLFDSEYHIYAGLWDEEKIQIFMDGNLVREFTEVPGYKFEPMQIFVDVYNPGYWAPQMGDTVFNYTVDYVRVYQRQGNCQEQLACNYNAQVNGAYEKSIVAGGAGCSHGVPQNTQYQANDFVILGSGVSVPSGVSLEATIKGCHTSSPSSQGLVQNPPTSNANQHAMQKAFVEQREIKFLLENE